MDKHKVGRLCEYEHVFLNWNPGKIVSHSLQRYTEMVFLLYEPVDVFLIWKIQQKLFHIQHTHGLEVHVCVGVSS